MNECDSAGGQRGRNLALPAGTDRIISSISSAGHLPVGPVVAASPMSRSPADERQHNFQQIQQQMQSTSSPAAGHLSKPLHHHQQQQQQQQQFPNNTVSLIPAGTVVVGTAGGAVTYKQQQFVVTSTNSANNNILLGGVSNIGNESNNTVVIGAQQQLVGSGVRTQQIIGSGNNNNSSASGIIIANQIANSSNSGNTSYIHQASGVLVTGVASAGLTVGGPIGSSVPVSPTARKRLKLEQSPVVVTAEVEHDISALKKLILEHKYMRLKSIKESK
nr:uncharacterized protein LOC115270308 [Aedes albopictus]